MKFLRKVKIHQRWIKIASAMILTIPNRLKKLNGSIIKNAPKKCLTFWGQSIFLEHYIIVLLLALS